jgi:rubrerythrin
MNKTGPVTVRIGSRDDLLALAGALEQESAVRYRALSARMRHLGDAPLAAQFATLAEIEDRHAVHVAERSRALLGRAPDPAPVGWELPAGHDAQEAAGATLSAYQALAFAVRNEERAFAFYTYVAAEAVDPDIRALAEDLARDELRHAAQLRHHRRRAFHADRPEAVERPETVDALQALARRWDAEAAAAHTALAAALDAAGEADDATIFRRLAAQEADTARGAVAAAVPALRNAADGLRLVEAGFDRYALIGERADDEQVLAEAQRLAGDMLARLALAGGARRNALLGARAG